MRRPEPLSLAPANAGRVHSPTAQLGRPRRPLRLSSNCFRRKEQQRFEAKALHPLDAPAINLTPHLIALQVRTIDAKKYLLGLYLLLGVVFTYRLR